MSDKTDSLKSTFDEFLSSSTIHGLPKILKAKYPFSKFTWAIFSCIALASCSFFIYDKCANYLEYQVITNTEEIAEKSPEFPTVTICAKFNYSNYIEACLFNGQPCNWSSINQKNILCIEFNTGISKTASGSIPIEILRSNYSGSSKGLAIVMRTSSTLQKFKVYVNNPASEVDRRTAIETSLGQDISLMVKRTFINKLPSPYSKCRAVETFSNSTTTSSYAYFKSKCQVLCRDIILAGECNMTEEFAAKEHLFYTDPKIFSFLYYDLTQSCNRDVQIKVDNMFRIMGYEALCQHRCPIECNTISYHLKPRYFFRSSRTDMQRAFISVFYENFVYTKIEEIPMMESFDLFGYIGGFFGNENN